MGEGRLSFLVQLSSQVPAKVHRFSLYKFSYIYKAIQFAIRCFLQSIQSYFTVRLTFVVLSHRVQHCQRTASPLWTRVCIPATVPLHGLLLQQAAPCLLLPHGW